MTKVYTQAEVDSLRAGWGAEEFQKQTNDVLATISHRLDESNNYKDTIGRNVRSTMERIEVLETQRRAEANQIKTDLLKRREWWQDSFIRGGIVFSVLYEVVNVVHTLLG